ncbi:MAG: hypothetical protein ACLU4N_23580 [Butyricimonas faecihominis]
MQQARIYPGGLPDCSADVKNLVALELTRLYGSLILRDSSAEEAIRFISRVPSKVVFTREEEAKFYYLGACFFKSIDIDRAFRAVDQALSLYRGLSDTEGEIEAYRLKATLYGVLQNMKNNMLVTSRPIAFYDDQDSGIR